MRVVAALALAGLVLLGATDRSSARVQAQMYCWEFDSEFPVPCEQEDEEDGGFRGRFQVRDTGIAGLRPET
jgi:hypothetical protein